MNEIIVKTLSGNDIERYIPDLANLRIKVFRDYPYLYDGNYEYEKNYLKTYSESEGSALIIAFWDNNVIGVSTCIPMIYETENIKEPFLKLGDNLESIFYFGESVLLKEYRGSGIGVEFFRQREEWAKKLGKYELMVFCGVQRTENDSRKPNDYIPLDSFWKKRGFSKMDGYTCKISWQEIGETVETTKSMQFWGKKIFKG